MVPLRLSGEEFAWVLAAGQLHERVVDSGQFAVVVEVDGLPKELAARSMASLRSLAAVVVGEVGVVGAGVDPAAPIDPIGPSAPAWVDVAVPTQSAALEAVLQTVAQHPMASTTLAVLLRTGQGRSAPDGLVAESTAYGLLQGGPEFARWRAATPVRERPAEPGPLVRTLREGDQLAITLDRPQVLNAFNAQMRDELLAALEVATVDPAITSVSLRGAGPSFCSGGDLDEFGTRPDPVSAHLVRLQRSVGRELAGVADRTTAHIHGSTVGSGIELAAFAGRVVAHPSTRISLPEVGLGLIPGAGGTVSLPGRIGRHATALLALDPSGIDAATALAWGLVDELEG